MYKHPTKFRKQHKFKVNNFDIEYKKHKLKLCFGSYGLKVIETGKITPKQIEMIRRLLAKYVKKLMGQIWFRYSARFSLTRKPKEIRMGKGKGAITHWVDNIKKGTIIVELTCTSIDFNLEILAQIQKKFPLKTKIINFRKY